MAGKQDKDSEHGVALQVREKTKTRRPRMYRVILHNDDFSPMDFVVHLLKVVFRKGTEDATRIMLQVHSSGRGLAGIYTHEIAETKVAQVHAMARQAEHPLMASLEPEEPQDEDNGHEDYRHDQP